MTVRPLPSPYLWVGNKRGRIYKEGTVAEIPFRNSSRRRMRRLIWAFHAVPPPATVRRGLSGWVGDSKADLGLQYGAGSGYTL